MSFLDEVKQYTNQHDWEGLLEFFIKQMRVAKMVDREYINYCHSHKLLDKGNVLFNKELLIYLNRFDLHEEIYEIYKSREYRRMSEFEIHTFLQAIHSMGMLKTFEQEVKKVNEYYLVNKYYSGYQSFYDTFYSTAKNKTHFKIGMITYLCERCELSSLFNYLAEYEEVVLEERVKYEEVKTIYQIIESVRKDHYLLYKYKLFFKLILAKGSDEQYGLKDQVEYLLMSDKLTDYILIWSCLGQKEIKQKLSEFIMKKYKVRSLEVPKLLKEFKNEIQKKIKITVDKNKSSTESIEEHEDGKTIENIQLTTVLPPSPNQPIKYKTSQAESDLLSLIKIEDEAFYSNADLVVSFIELNFLNMAEKIAISLDNSSNKKYLIAYIKLLKGHYSESIEECNECLSYYQLTAEQTVPFEYIKAEAFEQMGDRVSALRCYRNVIKYDPEFRQAQEKLNEQAK